MMYLLAGLVLMSAPVLLLLFLAQVNNSPEAEDSKK